MILFTTIIIECIIVWHKLFNEYVTKTILISNSHFIFI